MSRTRKGSKGAGHEYWSKRPNSMSVPGKESKKRTHRLERIEDKKVEKIPEEGVCIDYCYYCGEGHEDLENMHLCWMCYLCLKDPNCKCISTLWTEE
jgi:hypothetical protein